MTSSDPKPLPFVYQFGAGTSSSHPKTSPDTMLTDSQVRWPVCPRFS